MTNQKVLAWRRQIKRDLDLPMKDAYGEFVGAFICSNLEPSIEPGIVSDTKLDADGRLHLE